MWCSYSNEGIQNVDIQTEFYKSTADFFVNGAGIFVWAVWSTAVISYYETGEYTQFKEYFIHAYENTVKKYELKSDPEIIRDFSIWIRRRHEWYDKTDEVKTERGRHVYSAHRQ